MELRWLGHHNIPIRYQEWQWNNKVYTRLRLHAVTVMHTQYIIIHCSSKLSISCQHHKTQGRIQEFYGGGGDYGVMSWEGHLERSNL